MPDTLSIFREALSGVSAEIDISLSDRQQQQLERHFSLLQRWNARINLTTVIDAREAARRHFGESLFLAKQLADDWRTLVDVGSGGGFPGFPVAVVFPDRQVTLVESRSKKVAFLKEVSRETPNVLVASERFEDVPALYDAAVVRGVNIAGIIPKLREAALGGIAVLGDAGTAIDLQDCGFKVRIVPLPWEVSRSVVLAERSRL